VFDDGVGRFEGVEEEGEGRILCHGDSVEQGEQRS
jgi:hypothetical protein